MRATVEPRPIPGTISGWLSMLNSETTNPLIPFVMCCSISLPLTFAVTFTFPCNSGVVLMQFKWSNCSGKQAFQSHHLSLYCRITQAMLLYCWFCDFVIVVPTLVPTVPMCSSLWNCVISLLLACSVPPTENSQCETPIVARFSVSETPTDTNK